MTTESTSRSGAEGERLDGGRTLRPGELAPPPEATRLRWLPGTAILACAAGFAAVGLLKIEHELGVQHFRATPFVALMLVMFGASGFALVLAVTNPIRWRAARVSPWWVLVALLPVALWAVVGVYGFRNWSVRYVPNDFLMNLAKRAGASLMEGEVALRYPYRIAGRRVVMFHRGVSHPGDDVALMDAYLAELEALLGRPVRVPIHWVRGELLGMDSLSLYGLALGSTDSLMDPDSGIPGGRRLLDPLDRHEAAHAVMAGLLPPSADVPTMLSEGWASACGDG